MASGFIIACGRAFQITAAQNWAVVDATSGVARLLLTIDLTRTATENTFDQISFNLEYAAAEDGFVDIVQEDINLSGTKYQIVAAVVSLGTGGITGIVSKLEKTEGGGGGLNFKVVPGLTQPGAATENTIWVKTEKMTGWVFSVTEPAEPAEGMVWITTGTSSAIEFNALKKNAIQVYPISAKQYIGGAWVDVTAMSYQGGEWTEWRTYLYNSGDECTEITGGWAKKRPSGYFSSNGSVVKNAQTMKTTATKGQYIVAVTTNKINLADLNTLTFNVYSRQNGNAEYIFLCVFDDTLKDINAIAKIEGDSVQIGTNIIDITSLNDAYYIGFGCASESGTASIEVSEVSMT